MSRLGFAKLSEIAPDQAGDAPPASRIDAIGERHGFTSREPAERLYKNDTSKEATVPLSIRPPLSVANRFVAWCKVNRYSYWEGLNELMKRAGI